MGKQKLRVLTFASAIIFWGKRQDLTLGFLGVRRLTSLALRERPRSRANRFWIASRLAVCCCTRRLRRRNRSRTARSALG